VVAETLVPKTLVPETLVPKARTAGTILPETPKAEAQGVAQAQARLAEAMVAQKAL